MEPKFCRDCVHKSIRNGVGRFFPGLSIFCKRQEAGAPINLVTGKQDVVLLYPAEERARWKLVDLIRPGKRCGPEGKFFEPVDNT